MIFIVVKFPVRPERSDEWMSLVADFTKATRAEPGNLFFEWSRSVDDPNEFVLVEAFVDGEAGAAHVAFRSFQDGHGVTAGRDLGHAEDRERRGARRRLGADGRAPTSALAPRTY